MAEKVAGSRYSSIAYQRRQVVRMCWRRRFILPVLRPRQKDKATFGSAYKVENGVNKYNLEDGSKISIHGTYYAEGITPGKGTTSVVTVGDGTGTLSIDTSSSDAGNSQGRGFSHLTGAG